VVPNNTGGAYALPTGGALSSGGTLTTSGTSSTDSIIRIQMGGSTGSSTCGNGVVDVANDETCDDGEFNGQHGYCSAYCLLDPCSEECDGGVNDSGDGGCSSSCLLGPYCGDGTKNGQEQCDTGDFNSPVDSPDYAGCLVTCQLGPYCGDGIVQGSEQCDMGDLNGTNNTNGTACTVTCRVPIWLPD
jgi:hypothetical protein